MLEWVKSKVDYYRRIPEIAAGSDALEVMFKRADCLAAEVGQNGFIPDHMLHHLVRKPTQAKRLADQLVKAHLWDRVRGGYLIVDWSDLNAELVRLQAKKQRDRERKRADRAAERDNHSSVDASVDGSTDAAQDSPSDSPTDSLYAHRARPRTRNAAAATRAAREPSESIAGDLPPAVAILRSALDARKLTVRWDRLTADELEEIEQLIEIHGDAALVRSALHAYQPNKPPVYAKAWLNGWRQLRAPGDLASVPARCPDHPALQVSATGVCSACASERLERKTP